MYPISLTLSHVPYLVYPSRVPYLTYTFSIRSENIPINIYCYPTLPLSTYDPNADTNHPGSEAVAAHRLPPLGVVASAHNAVQNAEQTYQDIHEHNRGDAEQQLL